MANTDKDIVITPNRGSATADPTIRFTGGNATVANSVNVTMYADGTLSFDGTAGQLFSITNNISGTIFSVNDISGIPSIEVTDTGLIKIAQYNGNVGIGTATVKSGVELAVFGGNIQLGTSGRAIEFPDGTRQTTAFISPLAVNQGGTGLQSGTSGGVLYYSAAGTLASSAALAASALVVGGGAGGAPSTVTTGTGVVTALGVNTGTAGAFVVNGGALGTPLSGNFSTGTFTWPTFNQNTTGYAAGIAGGALGQLHYQTAANTTGFVGVGTSGWLLTGAGAALPQWTQAATTNTASTIVQRDASGNFSAGTITASLSGNATSATTATSATSATTATNIAGGALGQLHYQTGAGTTGFVGVGTSGWVLVGAGSALPQWILSTNANTASTIVQRDASGNFSAGTITATLSGSATSAGTATTATNIAGGALGQLHYQSAAGTTAFVGVGTSGWFLTGAGSALPQWTQVVPAANGGTGQSTYAVGDILYASTTSALSKLAGVATGNSLISGGVGVAPSWGKIGLTTHVSGTLAIANGGTNSTATPTNGGVSYGTGTAYAFTAAGTQNQALISNGAAAPSWVTLDLTYLPDAAFKKSVRVATTANITLSGTQTIDGIAVVANDRVLVKDQTAAAENGIYTVAAGAWTRAADADTISEIAGGTVNVDQGTAWGSVLFSNSLKTTDTLGTTAMNWSFLINNNATQTMTAKTLSTNCTWNGNAIGVGYGGTGLTSGFSGGVLYFSAAGTIASSTALTASALVVGGGAGAAPSTITTGTGVVTALGVNTGSAGAFVVNGGALGTPSSGTLTNCTSTTLALSNNSTNLANSEFINRALYNVRGAPMITGGGTVSYDGTNVKWTSRFIVIGNSKGTSSPGSADYYDILCPSTGNVNVVGTTAVTATASGIPLPTWCSLYYDTSAGSAQGSTAFNIVNYSTSTANYMVPATWIWIASRNDDASYCKFANGLSLDVGQSYDMATYSSFKTPLTVNISGGSAGALAYQTAANTTGFVGVGTSGWVLTGAGAALPQWTQATNANTASTIVQRDASGNFSAGTITASLTGTASTATNVAGGALGQLHYQTGASTTGFVGVGTSGWLLLGQGSALPQWVQATNANTASTVVQRDASGNFSAGTITASLTGNATNVTGVVAAANGGTGQSSYAVGDLLYASTTTALSKLADVATGNSLISGGVGVAPSWGKIGLTTHVSGTLPVGNGGTGATTFTANGVLYGNTTGAVQVTAQGAANSILIANGGAPSFSASPTIGTSLTVPIVYGGTAASSTLTLQTTTAAGTSDSMLFRVGNAVQAVKIDTVGRVIIGQDASTTFNLRVNSSTLGTTAGSQSYYQQFYSPDGNADYLEITNTRETAGSSWVGAGSRIQQKVDGTWMGYIQFNGGNSTVAGGALNSGGISFGTGLQSGPTAVPEHMRIDTNGNVGIGTANPTADLHVQGNMSVRWFIEFEQTITANYTIRTGYNAMTSGPITINSGVTVTVPSGSTWTII